MKNYVKTIKEHSFLFLILILALALRFYGINWDQGMHLHPDERMLIMVAGKIHFFSQLNPDFFNYGSLPIYLLTGTSQFLDYAFKTNLNNYDGMLYIGRTLSVLADVLTVLLIYKIALVLFKDKKIASFASFFYAAAFFPIQNAHFFVVDVFLNLFAASLILTLLLYLKKPSLKKVLAISIISALIITTKFTGIIFLPVVFLVLILPVGKLPLTKQLINSFKNLLLFAIYYLLFTFLFMPYAFIQHQKFISDITAQIRMNSDPFIFPYTLQYVGTTPYFYYLKNMFLWGLGPMISSMDVIGLMIIVIKSARKILKVRKCQMSNVKCQMFSVLFLFYILYFLVIGRSAVKFMRYMLPLYPAFALLAGIGFNFIHLKSRFVAGLFAGTLANVGLLDPSSNQFISQKNTVVKYFKRGVDLEGVEPSRPGLTGLVPHRRRPTPKTIITFFLTSVNVLIVILTFAWTLMFVSIYSRPHTRISASEWIYKNIPNGATLAVEHWDDRLPLLILGSNKQFNFVELPLYEFDTQKKWDEIDKKLDEAQYLIIASNRLYIPLTRLVNCTQLPPNRCYLRTSKYYKNLFAGKLGYEKVAEFSSSAKFSIFNFQFSIDDSSADESFTVYDHPKIMIFKKK